MKTLCVPCFVFGPVFFFFFFFFLLLFFGAWHFAPFLAVQASYLEMGTGFCTFIAFCFYVCMYLFNWVLLFMFIGSVVAQW